METRTLECRKCGYDPTPEQFIDGVTTWWPDTRVAGHVCPNCGQSEEIQLLSDEVRFGYIYAAGSAHFAAMERAKVPGLLAWAEGKSLCIEYGSKTRKITART